MAKLLQVLVLASLIGLMIGVDRAQARELTIDLSDPVVQITAGFSGTDMLIFGVAPGEGDVVIVVRGPIRDEIVRKKDRVLGIWVNSDEVVFEGVPSLYLSATNRPFERFLPTETAKENQIGLKNIDLLPHKDYEGVEELDEFRDAFLRNKQKQGLYVAKPGDLIFLGNRLFRTKIRFPANVTVGTYGIDVFLIRNGEVVANETTLLNVRKFGVEAQVFNFAHRYSFAYGVIAVILAGIAGWAANAAFRKA